MPQDQLDAFMDAIAGNERDPSQPNAATQRNARTGAYGTWQVMPENWGPWAREAGLSGNAPRTPSNQLRVARHKMSQYHRQFGDWGAVAVAWFAGPGRAKRYLEGDQSVLDLSDGNMTVREYVEKAQRGMGGQRPSMQRGAVPRGVSGGGQQPQPFTPEVAQYQGGLFGGGEQPEGRADPLDDDGLEQLALRVLGAGDATMLEGGGGDMVEGDEGALDWARPNPDDPVAEGEPSIQQMMASSADLVRQAVAEPGDLGVPSDGRDEAEGQAPADAGGQQFLEAASQYLGTPYVWGGATPSGFDCSGLIQYVAREHLGVTLPRVSRDQARVGVEVSLDEAQPGDLIAFPARGLEVGHIGIVAGRDESGQVQMLHAPRSGRDVTVEGIGDRTVATVRRVPQIAGGGS